MTRHQHESIVLKRKGNFMPRSAMNVDGCIARYKEGVKLIPVRECPLLPARQVAPPRK
jgi:hypothetical protein